MLKEHPGAKLAVLYRNDDFGKDYVTGLRDVLGKDSDKYVVRTATNEVTDPIVDFSDFRFACGGGRGQPAGGGR